LNGFITVLVKNPNRTNVDATDAGINPFHAVGIDPIKKIEKRLITNTTTNEVNHVNHMYLSDLSIIEINNIHIKLLINVAHIRGSASRG
jgi:hypothetical protein